MVNMNKFKEPAVYGLFDQDGRLFYIGRTGGNSQNRLWEHNYRARSGHPAPVYVRMRQLGIENVSVRVLRLLLPNENAKEIEARLILDAIEVGHDLTNRFGLDGTPDSWSPEMRKQGIPSKRGKPTWIKGKTGEEAGWTAERRLKQSERMKNRSLPVVS